MKIRSMFPIAVFFITCSIARAGDEMPGKRGAEEEVTINLQNVDIMELIEIVQRETGAIFLFDQRVKQITDISYKAGKAIPRKALLSVFKSILETRNFGLTEVTVQGLVIYKITEARLTFTGTKQTYSGEEIRLNPESMPQDDTMVTVVYPLKYAEARNAMNQLRAIVNPNQGGNIIGIPNVNVLVVTGFGSVMQRIFRIIDLLDVPGPQPEWRVVKLLFADPQTVSQKVESILQTVHLQAQKRQIQAQPPGKLIPEPRTRSVIVQAMSEQMPEILSLIAKLDVKLDSEPAMVHIYRLKHTNAEDMEETVNAIMQADPDIGVEPVANAQGPMPLPSAEGTMPAPKAPSQLSRRRRTATSGTTGEEGEPATAIADKATNSLIIVAPEAYYNELKRIIDRLDVRRPQVLIEAVIVEISSASGVDVGAEIAILERAADGSTRGFGATLFGLSNIVDKNGNPITASSLGGSEAPIPAGRSPTWSGQGMTFGITAGKDFKIPILLTMLGSESDVNVLSLPRILTNENEEAEIKVTEAVPTAQSQSTAAVSAALGFSGFEEAGITLTITPHISENNMLRLKIEHIIEQFTGTSTVIEAGGVVLPPSKTTRELRNEVTVPSHKTVILGGLTSTTSRETTSKIPLLGDIPLIGNLFKRQKHDVKKTNLFVFITPHILDDPEFRDLERISDASLTEAKSLGAPTADIDRYYRAASRMFREVDNVEPGRTVSSLRFTRKGRDE